MPCNNKRGARQLEPKCKNCNGIRWVIDRGDVVCSGCGRVACPSYLEDFKYSQLPGNSKSYQRRFYFNERCSRWYCAEPTIPRAIWIIIEEEARKKEKYGDLVTRCNRNLISKILRSVVIPQKIADKYRSTKFKKQPLTQKAFYVKYFEKWKTIRWKLTGVRPVLPSHHLVDRVKKLFAASQIPFDMFRHDPNCDGRSKCDKVFKCQHNFTNYDYAFRVFLQICEKKYGFRGCYAMFKEEFPLVGSKVVRKKLRPMFERICVYNEWPIPEKD
jgi:hypothetical protein